MKEDIRLQKQIRYGSLSSRLLAAIFDNVLIFIFLTPLFKVTSSIFYGSINPSDYVQGLINKAIEKNVNKDEVFSYVMSSGEIYDYFIVQGYLFKTLSDYLFQMIVIMILMIFCWKKFSTSPGKKLLSLKIVDEKSFASPTIRQSVIRFLGYIVSILPLFLGIFWIGLNKKKQAWHDKFAGTVVIKI